MDAGYSVFGAGFRFHRFGRLAPRIPERRTAEDQDLLQKNAGAGTLLAKFSTWGEIGLRRSYLQE
jgi:hypothetical protein